ncbi:MAG: hypothetical protein AB8B71_01715 [Paracoccaceae bacterium]
MKKPIDTLVKLETLRGIKTKLELQAIQQKEDELRQAISKIDLDQKESLGSDKGLVPMRTVGADTTWYHWAEQEKTRLTQELLQTKILKEPVLAAAARQTGRQEVLSVLSKQSAHKDSFPEIDKFFLMRNSKNKKNGTLMD